jgi:hypothetical protein
MQRDTLPYNRPIHTVGTIVDRPSAHSSPAADSAPLTNTLD